MKGKIKFIMPGSNRIVDVRDVADAVIAGIEKGKSGERYLLGGQKYQFEDIYKILADVSGKPIPSKQPSPKILMGVAQIMTLVGKITGKPPALKPNILKRFQENFWYDSSRAENELGIQFRPLSETLSGAVQWFKSANFV